MKRIFMLAMLLAMTQGALAEEKGVVEKAGDGVKRGAVATERGVKKGAAATERGIKKGAEATERGVKKGVEATASGLKKAGEWIEKKVHPGDE